MFVLYFIEVIFNEIELYCLICPEEIFIDIEFADYYQPSHGVELVDLLYLFIAFKDLLDLHQ